MLQETWGSQKHYCKDWGEQGEHSLKDLQWIIFSKVHEEALLQDIRMARSNGFCGMLTKFVPYLLAYRSTKSGVDHYVNYVWVLWATSRYSQCKGIEYELAWHASN